MTRDTLLEEKDGNIGALFDESRVFDRYTPRDPPRIR